MNIAYLDCFSGISGDMLLGALLDAGLPAGELTAALDRLGLDGYRVTIEPAQASSLKATRVRVKVETPQPPRHLHEIETILNGRQLDDPVRSRALAVFRALAAAEAEVHRGNPDEVHFHEVGAVDALVDVVGTVAGFHLLGIEKIYCSPLPMPRGWVRCEHGDLPLPAPAVCRLLEGIPIYGEELKQELVTPTGAALVRTLADDCGAMPPMQLTGTGYGAGSNERSDGRPNLLRLITGIAHAAAETQQVEVIETALDDWSPESWPYVAEKLLNNGALDVLLIPIQMKKGRPGFLLRLICDPAFAEPLQTILFTETSAIGLRWHREQRRTLPRETVTVQTRWGMIQAKQITTPTGMVTTPEYEDCRRLAEKNKVSIRQVYDEICRNSKNNPSD